MTGKSPERIGARTTLQKLLSRFHFCITLFAVAGFRRCAAMPIATWSWPRSLALMASSPRWYSTIRRQRARDWNR